MAITTAMAGVKAMPIAIAVATATRTLIITAVPVLTQTLASAVGTTAL